MTTDFQTFDVTRTISARPGCDVHWHPICATTPGWYSRPALKRATPLDVIAVGFSP